MSKKSLSPIRESPTPSKQLKRESNRYKDIVRSTDRSPSDVARDEDRPPEERYEKVIKLIELEELKGNPQMSKAIKTQIMFNKKLTYFEPTIPENVVPQLLSPFNKVSLHLQDSPKKRDKSPSPPPLTNRMGSVDKSTL